MTKGGGGGIIEKMIRRCPAARVALANIHNLNLRLFLQGILRAARFSGRIEVSRGRGWIVVIAAQERGGSDGSEGN